MAKRSGSTNINVSYLKKFIEEKGLDYKKVAEELGYHNTYIYHVYEEKKATLPFAKGMCVLHGADWDKLTSKEEPAEEPKVDMTSTEKKLDEILDILKKSQVEIKVERNINDLESAILLLRNMLKYGSCEEKLYKEKARSEGFPNEIIAQAIRETVKSRRMINGKNWLEL